MRIVDLIIGVGWVVGRCRATSQGSPIAALPWPAHRPARLATGRPVSGDMFGDFGIGYQTRER
jgi:hypothetical protein